MTVGAAMVLIAIVIIPKLQVPAGVNASTSGSMREQWLAEHRTPHRV